MLQIDAANVVSRSGTQRISSAFDIQGIAGSHLLKGILDRCKRGR